MSPRMFAAAVAGLAAVIGAGIWLTRRHNKKRLQAAKPRRVLP